jgi:hypothetical protein
MVARGDSTTLRAMPGELPGGSFPAIIAAP